MASVPQNGIDANHEEATDRHDDEGASTSTSPEHTQSAASQAQYSVDVTRWQIVQLLQNKKYDVKIGNQINQLWLQIQEDTATSSAFADLDMYFLLLVMTMGYADPQIFRNIMNHYLTFLIDKLQHIQSTGAMKSAQERLEPLVKFLKMCLMRRSGITEDETANPSTADLLMALLSVFLDLFIIAHREVEVTKGEQRQMTKLAKQLTAGLGEKALDATLQMTVVGKDKTHEGTAYFSPLIRYLMREKPAKKSCSHYLRYVLTACKWRHLWTDLEDVIAEVRTVRAPKGLVEWVKKWHSAASSQLPDYQKFKGRTVTTFLLDDADENIIDLLKDTIVFYENGVPGGDDTDSDREEKEGETQKVKTDKATAVNKRKSKKQKKAATTANKEELGSEAEDDAIFLTEREKEEADEDDISGIKTEMHKPDETVEVFDWTNLEQMEASDASDRRNADDLLMIDREGERSSDRVSADTTEPLKRKKKRVAEIITATGAEQEADCTMEGATFFFDRGQKRKAKKQAAVHDESDYESKKVKNKKDKIVEAENVGDNDVEVNSARCVETGLELLADYNSIHSPPKEEGMQKKRSETDHESLSPAAPEVKFSERLGFIVDRGENSPSSTENGPEEPGHGDSKKKKKRRGSEGEGGDRNNYGKAESSDIMMEIETRDHVPCPEFDVISTDKENTKTKRMNSPVTSAERTTVMSKLQTPPGKSPSDQASAMTEVKRKKSEKSTPDQDVFLDHKKRNSSLPEDTVSSSDASSDRKKRNSSSVSEDTVTNQPLSSNHKERKSSTPENTVTNQPLSSDHKKRKSSSTPECTVSNQPLSSDHKKRKSSSTPECTVSNQPLSSDHKKRKSSTSESTVSSQSLSSNHKKGKSSIPESSVSSQSLPSDHKKQKSSVTSSVQEQIDTSTMESTLKSSASDQQLLEKIQKKSSESPSKILSPATEAVYEVARMVSAKLEKWSESSTSDSPFILSSRIPKTTSSVTKTADLTEDSETVSVGTEELGASFEPKEAEKKSHPRHGLIVSDSDMESESEVAMVPDLHVHLKAKSPEEHLKTKSPVMSTRRRGSHPTDDSIFSPVDSDGENSTAPLPQPRTETGTPVGSAVSAEQTGNVGKGSGQKRKRRTTSSEIAESEERKSNADVEEQESEDQAIAVKKNRSLTGQGWKKKSSAEGESESSVDQENKGLVGKGNEVKSPVDRKKTSEAKRSKGHTEETDISNSLVKETKKAKTPIEVKNSKNPVEQTNKIKSSTEEVEARTADSKRKQSMSSYTPRAVSKPKKPKSITPVSRRTRLQRKSTIPPTTKSPKTAGTKLVSTGETMPAVKTKPSIKATGVGTESSKPTSEASEDSSLVSQTDPDTVKSRRSLRSKVPTTLEEKNTSVGQIELSAKPKRASISTMSANSLYATFQKKAVRKSEGAQLISTPSFGTGRQKSGKEQTDKQVSFTKLKPVAKTPVTPAHKSPKTSKASAKKSTGEAKRRVLRNTSPSKLPAGQTSPQKSPSSSLTSHSPDIQTRSQTKGYNLRRSIKVDR